MLSETDSTNHYAAARADSLADGAVVLAEHQSAGRGRLGRRWEAPRGSSLLLSVLLHEHASSPLIPHAAVLAAAAACRAVCDVTDCRPRLRWPNDLVLSGRKLGGVLAESRSIRLPLADAPTRAVVIGLGINCLQQRGHFQNDLAEKATSLEIESTRPIDRRALARALLTQLDDSLSRPDRAAPQSETVHELWQHFSDDIGTRVTLARHGDVAEGTVVDVLMDGDLLVELDHGGRTRFESATTTRIW